MQQPVEGQAAPRPNGSRRFPPGDREQNDKLVVHVAGIPPMMPEDVIKQAALQFGPVKDFFKVTRHLEKAYEYTPCFGFITFEDEASAARALQNGVMNVGELRLNLNPRRPRNEYRTHGHGRHSGDFRGSNIPQGPALLPERPHVRNQGGSTHAQKQSIGSQFDNKGPASAPQKARGGSSTCTVYGLPESFAIHDLTERGNLHGRVINTHIFEYKDREGRRFGTLNFDSSSGAEEFFKKENGQAWGGCTVKITFEPFNIARRNNTPPVRQGHGPQQNFQRHEHRPFDGQKRFHGGGRGRYQPNVQGRFNQRGGFQQQGNFHPQPPFPMQPHYQPEPQFYEPQMMGYPQYQPQYAPVMNPPPMVAPGQYGPVGVVSPPPLGYVGQPVAVPGMPGTFHSPPRLPQGPGPMHPQRADGQIQYSNTTDYPHRFDGCRNPTVDDSPQSKQGSVSKDMAGMRNTSGEISTAVPTVHPGIGSSIRQADGQYPLVIKPDHYLQAGYNYGAQLPENVHPLNVHHAQHHAQVVQQAPVEHPVPVTVPETKDPEDPSNIFIKNIDDDIISKPEHLEAYCRKFGEIVSISLPTYPNGLIKGFGFVKFTTAEQALKAKEELNLKMVGRRRMFVSFAETSDQRHNRLAKFYDQGARDGVLRSPPDPLIPKIPESKKEDKSEAGSSEGVATAAIKNGDATAETPIEKTQSTDIKIDNAGNGNESSAITSTQAIEVGAVDDNEAKATEVVIIPSKEHINDGEEKKVKTGIKNTTRGRKLSADELIELDPAIKSIGKKPGGRRLSAEELKQRFIGRSRARSTESHGAAMLSSGDPSPAGIYTPNQRTTEFKTSDWGSLSNSSSEGGISKKKIQEINEIRKGGSEEYGKENILKLAVLKALKISDEYSGEGASNDTENVTKPEKKEDTVAAHPPTRPETQNSDSSAGSRVSQEEFSEALRDKFGQKIPSTIRATEVLDAVDQYVLSRSISQRSSPADNVEGSKPGEDYEMAQPAKRGTEKAAGNIVAPAPSRKVSVQRITPSDPADEEIMKVEEGKTEPGTEEQKPEGRKTVTTESQQMEEKQPVDITKLAPLSKAADKVKPEDLTTVDAPQNISTFENQEARGRNFDKVSAGNMKRNSGPNKQLFFGNNPGFQKTSRPNQGQMDLNYRSGVQNPEMFPGHPNARYPRGPEQPPNFAQPYGQPDERTAYQHNMNQGNGYAPPPPQHPPTMICEGPCCQPAYAMRYPPPEMQPGMFPGQMPGPMGQMPYFDPGVFRPGPYYGMDNGPPPPHPMFNAPGMFPQQWGNNPNIPPPNMPYPHGAFPMHPPGPRYSPPQAHNASPHMAGAENGNQNRPYPEYNQYPQHMAQQYGGPMFYEPAMPGPLPPMQGQGHYRPHGGPGVPTF
ncbi:hypothetical protein Dda_8494 [Drechslerella dactyloides]|uniref:RRM domain-containing protein n=1 Tax=Drechslerella dactyloides TaxID=74499 RepID=A0AAD6NFV7_DREDA|nr:hypothetical protein Dda_8494 [Drechslerella dactyloides]